ncbi:MAG: phage minor head protein [Bacteroidales bacterium]
MSSPHKLSLHDLYNCDCPDCRDQSADTIRLSISDTEEEAIQRAFNKVARWMYKRKTFTPSDISEQVVQPLINSINESLQDGLRRGLEHVVPYTLQRNLSENVFLFSGAKTYSELKTMSELLMEADGSIKPFNKFWQEVSAVHKDYNRNYLQAEYIFATQSAQMASKWSEIEEDGDRYNLQYRTAADDRVRDSHWVLHNTTLPPSDPFWDKFYPPNGWRCRCTAVQVRKSKYTESDPSQAFRLGESATPDKEEIFRFNPGKEQVIFPKHHPYFEELSKSTEKQIKRIYRQNETFTDLPTERGRVIISSNHGTNEARENIEIATYLANRYNYDIKLLGKMNEKKTADSLNKSLNITQEYKINKKASMSAIDNEVRSAAKQSDNIVLYIKSEIAEGDLRDTIQNRVRRAENVKTITIIRDNKDKTYSREEITRKDWRL